MGAFFAKEILDAAIQIERNGQLFYERMGQKAADKPAQEVFGRLAGQEREHLSHLRDLAGKLPDPPETWEREEFAMYMAELAESHVFRGDGSGEKAAQQVAGELAAVELGIRFEKDTILFLEGLQRMVREKERTVVGKLLEWERAHLVELVRLKWQITGKARSRA
jgi:rubrerythrin